MRFHAQLVDRRTRDPRVREGDLIWKNNLIVGEVAWVSLSGVRIRWGQGGVTIKDESKFVPMFGSTLLNDLRQSWRLKR